MADRFEVQGPWFYYLATGLKRIELRALDSRLHATIRQQPNLTLHFTTKCLNAQLAFDFVANGTTAVYHDFPTLFANHPPATLLPGITDATAAQQVYESYGLTVAKLATVGAAGIYIHKLSDIYVLW